LERKRWWREKNKTNPKHFYVWSREKKKEITQEKSSLKVSHFWGKQERQIVLKAPFLDINVM